jgi:hypothetical protein
MRQSKIEKRDSRAAFTMSGLVAAGDVGGATLDRTSWAR